MTAKQKMLDEMTRKSKVTLANFDYFYKRENPFDFQRLSQSYLHEDNENYLAVVYATRYAHWIYQNLMSISRPETTGHTNVLLMTQGFRNDLSFMSRPQKCFYLYGAHDIACK